jgi:hypothetical protein
VCVCMAIQLYFLRRRCWSAPHGGAAALALFSRTTRKTYYLVACSSYAQPCHSALFVMCVSSLHHRVWPPSAGLTACHDGHVLGMGCSANQGLGAHNLSVVVVCLQQCTGC